MLSIYKLFKWEGCIASVAPALLALLAAMPAVAVAQAVQGREVPVFTGNVDVRVNATAELSKVLPVSAKSLTAKAAERSRAMGQAAATLAAEVPGAEVQFSDLTGAPEVVRGSRPLTAAAPDRSATSVALDFVGSHLGLYGLSTADAKALRPVGESVSRRNGLRMVRVEQMVNGVPVFQSETRFLIDAAGRLVRSVGLLIPDASASAPPLEGLISPEAALVAAMRSVGVEVEAKALPAKSAASALEATVTSTDERIAGEVKSWVVYFPAAPGVLIPAWAQIIFTTGDADWYSLVDARTGVLLWRKNIRESVSTQQARFSVYVQADGVTPADSPAPHSPSTAAAGAGTQFPEISRSIVEMFTAQDLTASPNGWVPDGGTTTTGNNVDACVDRVGGAGEANVCDVGTIDNNGRPVGNPDGNGNNRDFLGNAVRNFNYNPAPQAGNPDAGDDPTGVTATQVAFRRGAVTQLFYISNWYHDQLFNLGFDEAAGNFQTTNFSGMGAGNDPVRADTQDSSSTNNATFSTPPDGASGRMQMFRFTGPAPDRDAALDAEIVIHELSHGLSNRLVGNAAGLNWDPGRGMGEGWSDFYALSLLNATNADDPDASYASGAYATYRFAGLTDNYVYGIRRFPITTDNSVNPLTWADVDATSMDMSGGIPVSPVPFNNGGGFEVHNVGEVWTLSLWEMRSRIIADPAGANGDVPAGNLTALQLVTDALKMTPINPSFTDARDALIDADCATNGCANEQWIWEGFADRGLGYKAVAPLGKVGASRVGAIGTTTLGESFSLPYLDVASVAIDDSLGNNNGALDPGEPIRLTVTLANPWRATAKGVASATATLTSPTAGVVIIDGASAYGPIAAQGSTAGDTFLITVSPTVTCGSTLRFTLQTTSALGTASVDFTLRAGAPAGNGAPVTYTHAAIGLAIPDGNLQGVTDTFSIADDYEIADLDVRLDSITHTWSGDLVVGVRGPSGYGAALAFRRGVFFGVPNSAGANFTNTVFDDDLAASAATDLNQTTPAAAPFTASWLPAFNSPIWGLFGVTNFTADTTGQLSRFDGTSTQGNWKLHVFDAATPDSGTLNSWSLIVTPRAFSCAVFTPDVALSATKTVTGTFREGGTVTYTVTITNSGTTTQLDNAGHELTDVLPATLTLVSADDNGSPGTVSTSGNTVFWDGSLPAVIGSVTLTITATINPGASGMTVSNQGALSFDANGDGTNEAAGVTDDPGTAAANDPTVFQVAAGAILNATKVISGGDRAEGGSVTYTVVITNSGGDQADNAGDEFTDVLPSSLTLISATATSGTAVANVGTNTVTWNGALLAGGSVTITINASIAEGTFNTTISNQGIMSFDSNGDLVNDLTSGTDDPATGPSDDPTSFVVGASSVIQIPTLSEWGALALALLLAVFALRHLRIGAA